MNNFVVNVKLQELCFKNGQCCRFWKNGQPTSRVCLCCSKGPTWVVSQMIIIELLSALSRGSCRNTHCHDNVHAWHGTQNWCVFCCNVFFMFWTTEKQFEMEWSTVGSAVASSIPQGAGVSLWAAWSTTESTAWKNPERAATTWLAALHHMQFLANWSFATTGQISPTLTSNHVVQQGLTCGLRWKGVGNLMDVLQLFLLPVARDHLNRAWEEKYQKKLTMLVESLS